MGGLARPAVPEEQGERRLGAALGVELPAASGAGDVEPVEEPAHLAGEAHQLAEFSAVGGARIAVEQHVERGGHAARER